MAKSTLENTNARLKVVLDVLEEEVWSGSTLNAGQVLAEAIDRIPFTEHEGELLSGGIPRGHKSLTTATAKLVKAGWLVKGRSGWTITEEGRKATVAFPSAESFEEALNTGIPVPADTPLPTEAPKKPAKKAAARAAAKAPAAKKAPAKKPASKAAKAVEKAAEALEEAVAPVVKAVRPRKAPAKAEALAAEVQATEKPSAELLPQPDAVAVAGDFNVLLGAPEDWAPQHDQAQMAFDSKDQLWKLTAELPAGSYLFKIALNRSWDENYGAFGVPSGANHELHHIGGPVTITYNHAVRDVIFS